jgi:hypothetical protein
MGNLKGFFNPQATKGFEIKPMDDYTVNVSIVLHP